MMFFNDIFSVYMHFIIISATIPPLQAFQVSYPIVTYMLLAIFLCCNLRPQFYPTRA